MMILFRIYLYSEQISIKDEADYLEFTSIFGYDSNVKP